MSRSGRYLAKRFSRRASARMSGLEESPAYKETIFTFAPKSTGAEEYKKLAQEVIQRVEEDRVARHSQDAA